VKVPRLSTQIGQPPTQVIFPLCRSQVGQPLLGTVRAAALCLERHSSLSPGIKGEGSERLGAV